MNFFQLDFKGGAVSYNSYLGLLDVDCRELDITYICVNSNQLIQKVTAPISAFAEAMRSDASVSANNAEIRGTVNLEFLAYRKGSWGLGSEPSIWERWTVNLSQKVFPEHEKDSHRRQLSDQLREELCTILGHLNSQPTYVPLLGSSQGGTEHIIDFSTPGISPYLFNISHVITNQSRPSVSVAMRRIFKDVRL